MARLFVAAALILSIATALWVVTRGDASQIDVPRAAPTTGEAPPSRVDAGREPSPSAPAATPRDRSATASTASAVLPPVPADAEWIEVVVLDGATGSPVSGAEVTWDDFRCLDGIRRLPLERRYRFVGAWDQRARAASGVVRADVQGCVRVPVVDELTTVYARHGALRGSLLCAAGEPAGREFHRLVLRPADTVVFAVRRHDGEAAVGARVDLVADRQGRGPFRHTLVSDHAGRVEVDPLQIAEDYADAGREAARRWSWRADVSLPGVPVEPVAFAVDPVPAREIPLRLPPTGHVRVRLTCEGEPVDPPWRLVLLDAADRSSGIGPSLPDWFVGADGWVEFACVPLGRRFVAIARESDSWSAAVAGPRSAGERVAVELDVAGARTLLTGRVLDERGVPLANATVDCELRQAIRLASRSVALDGAGRFRLWCDRAVVGRPIGLAVRGQRADGSPLRGDAVVDPLPSRRHHVGEIRLRGAPLLVAGRLSCGPGLDPEQVGLVVQRRGVATGAEWKDHGSSRHVLADGRFVVHGHRAAGEYRLVVDDPECLPVEPVAFEVGATDIEIAVERGRRLTARVLLPGGSDPEQVTLRVEARDERLQERIRSAPARGGQPLSLADWPRAEGDIVTYQWRALPRGEYDVEVFVSCFAEPVTTVPAVSVPGDAGGDPRLAALDLRPVLVPLTFDVRSAGPEPGSSSEPCWVYVLRWPLDAGRRCAGWPAASGGRDGSRSLVPRTPFDVLVCSYDRQPRRLTVSDGVVRAVLQPWPSVVLRFPAHASLPAGWSLRVELRADRPPAREVELAGGIDFELHEVLHPDLEPAKVVDGVATVTVGEGPHTIEVRLADGRGRSRRLENVTPATVFAANGDVTVGLSSDELAAAVARARR